MNLVHLDQLALPISLILELLNTNKIELRLKYSRYNRLSLYSTFV